MLAALAAVGVALLAAQTARAADFPVTTTSDGSEDCSPICTLRGAITRANASPGPDRIVFNIGTGAQTITLGSALPIVTGPVTIDGTTQPGWIGPPIIALDGSGAGAGTAGLRVSGGGSTIRGLVVHSFAGSGLVLTGGGDGNVVAGNFIGTDLTGAEDRGNGSDGIVVSGGTGRNTIGGGSALARNVVSGNAREGITLTSSDNTVVGNYVGTNASGSAAIANGLRGVLVNAVSGNTVGGASAALRNVISGNVNVGISIQAGTGNIVQGNYIGTDASGTAAVPNGPGGVQILGGSIAATGNTIGGSGAGEGNVISGNTGNGVLLNANVAGSNNNNVVVGNLIGTTASGDAPLGNSAAGVALANVGGDGDNTIGGTNPGEANTIAHNGGAGVAVNVSYFSNRLVGNRIFSNGGLGIDLNEDGVTPNDGGDADTGANNLQNFPVLASAQKLGSATQIVGSLSSMSSTTYRLDFYASAACDPSGNGEGETWLGNESVTTNSDGNGSFDTGDLFGSEASPGDAITATATDEEGNTSEFSACVEVDGGSGAGSTFVVNSNADTDDDSCTEGNCTLREAINAANDTPESDTISFDIEGSTTIRLATPLPPVTESVIIDGTTQYPYEGSPIVRVDAFREVANALTVNADESTVRGLALVRATAAGLAITGDGNSVERNVIGMDDLDNGTGVLVNGSSNSIGGVESENTIAFNSGRGVAIVSGTGNGIRRNSIHSNGGLGIDLAPNGVTRNDSGDGDSGANELQNFPVLTSAREVEEELIIQGTINSGEGADLTVELYADFACDPSGNGEGRVYLGSQPVELGGDGNGSFEARFQQQSEGISVVTATATDTSGNTSEFSECRSIGDTGGEGLTLTVDAGANPAGSGTLTVPLASIPSNQLNSFSGSPDAAPVGSTPVGSIPVGSIPVGSIPVGSIPVGSIPVGSIPVGSIPVGSIPVGSIGPNAIPAGPRGLNQILLTSLPVTWAPILAGTPLERRMLQALTLADVYANATARGEFAKLLQAAHPARPALLQSLFGGVSLAALLLGDKTLSEIPPPGAANWCEAITEAKGSCAGVDPSTNTVAGLGLASTPVGSIPVGSIPVGSIAGGIAGTPVGSIPVGSIDIAATPLAAILLTAIPNVNAVVDCARISCTTDRTLGHAAALVPTAIRPGALLSALQAVLGDITLNELIVGIVPRSALAWEKFPIDGLQLFTARPVRLRYTVEFDLECASKAGLAVTVKLPDGDIALPGTTTLSYGDAAEIAGPNPATDADTGATWTGLPDPCPSAALETQHIRLAFDALSGFDLGVGTASARVSAGGEIRSVSGQAPVLVHQNWEANDDIAPTAPLVQPDQLVIGHVARAGDQEVFRTPIPAGLGTVTTFYLSHMGEDVDFDLVITGPGSPPLQSSPVGSIPVGSIPIEDKGSDSENSTEPLPPETLQDIPVGSIPVASISANRGDADEVAKVVARGETGFYTIIVRGYNGASSREPFVLRVKRTPAPPLPPCPPRGLTGGGAAGTLPPGVAPDTKTLFLVNRQRMTAMYGAADTNAMLASLNALTGRAEVKGAVLPVDGNLAVRQAYTAWDATPCNVEAANNVVRRINDVVTTYRNTLSDLRYVVLLGSDDALPMARVPDRVSVSPETDFAAQLQFTTSNLTRGNSTYAAAALGYFLTDGGYGAFTRIPWLGRELLLPQVPVSRLVESAADIRAQLDQYVVANGQLDPKTALTTGYDFLTDGAVATGTALAALVGQAGAHELIGDTWTKQDLVSRYTGKTPPDDINSISAHFNQWQLEPASAASGNDLLSTSDIPAPGLDPAFKNRILFTVGCHGGFNVPNTLAGAPAPPQAVDWAESWARQKAAVYVANTGFGYGDTAANALSERLMSIFAAKLGQAKPIGELWNDAQHEYYAGAGAYDVYDEKALVEASLFGLPFWRIAGATAPQTPTPPPVVPDPVTGLPVARLTITPGANGVPPLTENTTPAGRFWDLARGTQATHFRPLQPRFETDVTRPGQVARGIMITSLVTNDVQGVDPVLANPTIDLAAHELERNFRDVVFPANLVNLTRSRGLRGDRQGFVLNAGQFRPETPAGPTGIERLVQSIGVEVAYSPSTETDTTPPSIRQVGSTFTGGQATIMVDVTDPAKRVAALFNDTISWRFAELSNIPGTSFWTATVPTTHTIEVAAMAQDAVGNVGYSTNKGFNFLSVLDTGGPDILIDSPLPGAVYTLRQAVPARYACSDPAGVESCVGSVPNGANIDTSTVGPHTFTVTSTDLGGRQTSKSVEYLVRYSFDGFLDPNNVRFKDPPKLNTVTARDLVQLFFKLKDAGGGAISDTSAVTSIYSRQLDCNARPPAEAEGPTVPPTDDFFYVPSKQSFKYMWRTEQAWARSCRRLVFVLDDGSKRFLDFKFR